MPDFTVVSALGIIEGDLIELSRGRSKITGLYERLKLFGWVDPEPGLIVNGDIGDVYNVVAMIKHGWALRIIECSPSIQILAGNRCSRCKVEH